MAFSRGRLATNLPLLPRRLQLPIPVGVNLLLTPGEHVLRRDVADRTVQADVVVMLDLALHQTPSGRFNRLVGVTDLCPGFDARSLGNLSGGHPRGPTPPTPEALGGPGQSR